MPPDHTTGNDHIRLKYIPYLWIWHIKYKYWTRDLGYGGTICVFIIGHVISRLPNQVLQTLHVWRQGDLPRFSPNASHWPTSYDFGAGDIMIGLNKRALFFWGPGPIFEFTMPNPSV